MNDKDLDMIQENKNRITALEATFEYFKQSVEMIRLDIKDIKKKLDDKYVSKEYVHREIERAIQKSEEKDPFNRFTADLVSKILYISIGAGLVYALLNGISFF